MRSPLSIIHLSIACAALSATAQPAAVPTVDVVPNSGGLVVTRSEFGVNGKDPFFPISIRNRVITKTPDIPEPVTFDDLSLKGIGRGLAIINNRTFAIGEEANVKIKGVTRKVKLLKILSENRVVVEVNGVTQELILNQR